MVGDAAAGPAGAQEIGEVGGAAVVGEVGQHCIDIAEVI